jgi:hypothetical protein
MWKRRPALELVDGWIGQALALTEPESEARARALVAQAYWHAPDDPAAAREASALAERVGNPELRSYAWMARGAAAGHQGRFGELSEWSQRRFDLLGEITDPDHVVEMLETAVPAAIALGRFREGRRLAQEHIGRSLRLTPHHRVHGISLAIEVEEAVGGWEAIRGLRPEIEEAVAANSATPCIRNGRGLLLLAVAHEEAGESGDAAELEAAADRLGMSAAALIAPRARLALARGDRARLRALLDEWPAADFSYGIGALSTRLDVLAALRDRERLEAEAPRFLHANTYLEPFALRALGIVRDDEELISRATAGFEALRLDWHAAQTEALVEQT